MFKSDPNVSTKAGGGSGEVVVLNFSGPADVPAAQSSARVATNTGFELGPSRLYQKPQRTWFTPGNLAILTLISFIVGIIAGTVSGL